MANGPKPYIAPAGTHREIAAAMVAIWNAYWARCVPRATIAQETGIPFERIFAFSWQTRAPDLSTAKRIVSWYKDRWPDWAQHGR